MAQGEQKFKVGRPTISSSSVRHTFPAVTQNAQWYGFPEHWTEFVQPVPPTTLISVLLVLGLIGFLWLRRLTSY